MQKTLLVFYYLISAIKKKKFGEDTKHNQIDYSKKTIRKKGHDHPQEEEKRKQLETEGKYHLLT